MLYSLNVLATIPTSNPAQSKAPTYVHEHTQTHGETDVFWRRRKGILKRLVPLSNTAVWGRWNAAKSERIPMLPFMAAAIEVPGVSISRLRGGSDSGHTTPGPTLGTSPPGPGKGGAKYQWGDGRGKRGWAWEGKMFCSTGHSLWQSKVDRCDRYHKSLTYRPPHVWVCFSKVGPVAHQAGVLRQS